MVADLETSLAEIVVWSRDLERSLAFYRDLLGFTEMEQKPEVKPRFLQVAEAAGGSGGVPQMMVLVPHPEPHESFPTNKADRPLHHMAFAVSAAGYDDLEVRCRDSGLEVRGGVHPVLRAVRTFYIDDPDGNEVEIIGLVA